MFGEIFIGVFIEGSDFMVEEVIDHQLVNIISKFCITGIFILSHSSEFVHSLDYLVFVIDNFDSVEPTSLRLTTVFDFEHDSVGLGKSFLRFNLVIS